LSPIYPSPFADGGYDIADHTAIDPRFGTLDDFDARRGRARARPEAAAGPRAVPHVDRARVVPRPSRALHLVAGRRPAQQLARHVRRSGLVAGPARPRLVPALVLSPAARS